MNPRARRASFLTRCLPGLSLIASGVAGADVQTPRAAIAPAAAETYQDHYIAGGTLAPDISTGDYGTSDTSGLARSIRVDGVVSALRQEGPGAAAGLNENGLIVSAQWDTASYGAWSADAAGGP